MHHRPFSVLLFVFIVCLFSWPFQLIYAFFGPNYRPLLLVSMVMVAVGTYVCGKYIFKDGFARAGWQWGKPKHYIGALALALFLWAVPSLVEISMGMHTPAEPFSLLQVLSAFLFSFVLTLIPAFGEEFSWRGYLLPRLLKCYSHRKAVLLHGFVTWFWHLPVLVVMGQQMGGNLLISISLVLIISLIPTVMHAVVFAYIWSVSGSLAVATVYHSAFDEVRDALEGSVGLGVLGQNWQMLVLTVMGIVLLWKKGWMGKENPRPV